jgi:hypothetical protein
MPDVPSKSPVRLDRAALERVLARAAELATSSGDTTDEFTEEQLIELGKEVGLSPQNLRQALAEERTRSVVAPEDTAGIATQLFGPARVVATRAVPGTPANVLAALDSWMQNDELLQVKRKFGERIVWEARRDVMIGLKRAFRSGGRDYALSRAHEVAVTVVPVSENRVHVSLDADLSTYRRSLGKGTAQSAAFGAALGIPLMFIPVFPVALIAAPFVGVTALAYYRNRAAGHAVVSRAQLALEQMLDRLERGESPRPPTLLDAISTVANALPRRPR